MRKRTIAEPSTRPQRVIGRRRTLLASLIAIGAVMAGGMVAFGSTSDAVAQAPARAGSGLALPRFVSLKANPVNLRKGPGLQFPVAWVFQRAGIPLEVVREYGEWREVRDASGTKGWVLGSLLSGRRTALVQPWERPTAAGGAAGAAYELALSALRRRASSSSATVAQLEAGSLVSVTRCDGQWCFVALLGFQGFIEQRRLWGVYPAERF